MTITVKNYEVAKALEKALQLPETINILNIGDKLIKYYTDNKDSVMVNIAENGVETFTTELIYQIRVELKLSPIVTPPAPVVNNKITKDFSLTARPLYFIAKTIQDATIMYGSLHLEDTGNRNMEFKHTSVNDYLNGITIGVNADLGAEIFTDEQINQIRAIYNLPALDNPSAYTGDDCVDFTNNFYRAPIKGYKWHCYLKATTRPTLQDKIRKQWANAIIGDDGVVYDENTNQPLFGDTAHLVVRVVRDISFGRITLHHFEMGYYYGSGAGQMLIKDWRALEKEKAIKRALANVKIKRNSKKEIVYNEFGSLIFTIKNSNDKFEPATRPDAIKEISRLGVTFEEYLKAAGVEEIVDAPVETVDVNADIVNLIINSYACDFHFNSTAPIDVPRYITLADNAEVPSAEQTKALFTLHDDIVLNHYYEGDHIIADCELPVASADFPSFTVEYETTVLFEKSDNHITTSDADIEKIFAAYNAMLDSPAGYVFTFIREDYTEMHDVLATNTRLPNCKVCTQIFTITGKDKVYKKPAQMQLTTYYHNGILKYENRQGYTFTSPEKRAEVLEMLKKITSCCLTRIEYKKPCIRYFDTAAINTFDIQNFNDTPAEIVDAPAEIDALEYAVSVESQEIAVQAEIENANVEVEVDAPAEIDAPAEVDAEIETVKYDDYSAEIEKMRAAYTVDDSKKRSAALAHIWQRDIAKKAGLGNNAKAGEVKARFGIDKKATFEEIISALSNSPSNAPANPTTPVNEPLDTNTPESANEPQNAPVATVDAPAEIVDAPADNTVLFIADVPQNPEHYGITTKITKKGNTSWFVNGEYVREGDAKSKLQALIQSAADKTIEGQIRNLISRLNYSVKSLAQDYKYNLKYIAQYSLALITSINAIRYLANNPFDVKEVNNVREISDAWFDYNSELNNMVYFVIDAKDAAPRFAKTREQLDALISQYPQVAAAIGDIDIAKSELNATLEKINNLPALLYDNFNLMLQLTGGTPAIEEKSELTPDNIIPQQTIPLQETISENDIIAKCAAYVREVKTQNARLENFARARVIDAAKNAIANMKADIAQSAYHDLIDAIEQLDYASRNIQQMSLAISKCFMTGDVANLADDYNSQAAMYERFNRYAIDAINAHFWLSLTAKFATGGVKDHLDYIENLFVTFAPPADFATATIANYYFEHAADFAPQAPSSPSNAPVGTPTPNDTPNAPTAPADAPVDFNALIEQATLKLADIHSQPAQFATARCFDTQIQSNCKSLARYMSRINKRTNSKKHCENHAAVIRQLLYNAQRAINELEYARSMFARAALELDAYIAQFPTNTPRQAATKQAMRNALNAFQQNAAAADNQLADAKSTIATLTEPQSKSVADMRAEYEQVKAQFYELYNVPIAPFAVGCRYQLNFTTKYSDLPRDAHLIHEDDTFTVIERNGNQITIRRDITGLVETYNAQIEKDGIYTEEYISVKMAAAGRTRKDFVRTKVLSHIDACTQIEYAGQLDARNALYGKARDLYEKLKAAGEYIQSARPGYCL